MGYFFCMVIKHDQKTQSDDVMSLPLPVDTLIRIQSNPGYGS